MSKYQYTDNCREISGLGGGYEENCRKMVVAGMEWLDEHAAVDLNFSTIRNIYGVIFPENDSSKEITIHMNKSCDHGATGAMMQACVAHVMRASTVGWDQYIKDMEEQDNEIN